MPTQTKSACEYGDVAVEFDKEELTTIKTESSSVGIRVIGYLFLFLFSFSFFFFFFFLGYSVSFI